jgi:hypothetical protein
MKKFILFFCSAIFLAGCASLTVSEVNSKNRENLVKLYVGQTRSNALTIMGESPVNLDCADKAGKCTRQVIIANPYRTETVQSADRRFEVVYYAIDIKDDCTVSEDGLLPLVFEKDKLMGWGKEFLQALKK